MITLGMIFGVVLAITSFFGFTFFCSDNLIMLVIYLELLLLSIGLFFLHFSFILDDLIGANITLFFLPIAGAESAIALALLVAYKPLRGTLAVS